MRLPAGSVAETFFKCCRRGRSLTSNTVRPNVDAYAINRTMQRHRARNVQPTSPDTASHIVYMRRRLAVLVLSKQILH